MPSVICPVCSSEFHRAPSEVAKRKTCSRKCAAVLFRNKGETIPCKRCGKPFYRRASQARQGFGTCCSRECHHALRVKTVERSCLQCSGHFTAPHYEVNVLGRGKFCSRSCKDLFRRKFRKRGERNMFTNWQKREWKADQCAKCNSTERLELDHIVPRFAGGTTERTNAQTLCRTCNRKKFWTEDYGTYLSMLEARCKSS